MSPCHVGKIPVIDIVGRARRVALALALFASSACLAHSGLQRADRANFAEALARQSTEMELTLAAKDDKLEELATALLLSGAVITAKYPDAGALVARVRREQVPNVIDDPRVLAWRAEPPVTEFPGKRRAGPVGPVRMSTESLPRAAQFASGINFPNFYTGGDAIGMTKWWQEHPTFDGRGTLLVLPDGRSVDLLHPSLTRARNLDGKLVRKVAAIINVGQDRRDGWLDGASYDDSNERSTVQINGATYRKPARGIFKYAILDEDWEAGERKGNLYAKDFNRDRNPRGSSSKFGVAWSSASRTAWIDLDQDGDFANEKPLQSYRESGDILIVGKDDPTTPVVESVATFVEFDASASRVWIGTSYEHYHPTAVAGAAIGHDILGRPLHAPAPAARLVTVNPDGPTRQPSYSTRAAGSLADVDAAFSLREADVVQASMCFESVSSLPLSRSGEQGCRLDDWGSPIAVAIDRLIEKTGALFVYAGDNNSRSLLGNAMSQGMKGLSVGAYSYRNLISTHLGVTPNFEEGVASIGARGPGIDGAITPMVLAPSGILTLKPVTFPEDRFSGPWTLPPGVMFGAGTSVASPVGSGMALSMISAAKQTHLKYDAETLKRAIISGARWIGGAQAHEQGNGLIQIGPSWSVLQRLAKKQLIHIESRGTVSHLRSAELTTPNEGPGIYEREGWKPGQSGVRVIRLKRLNGPVSPQTYRLRWKGNDGTFSVQETVALPLMQTVEVKIGIQPHNAGVHSAIVDLLDADGDFVHQFMICIVAAQDFPSDGRLVIESDVQRVTRRSFYVRVPEGVSALVLKYQVKNGALAFNRVSPSNVFHNTTQIYFDKDSRTSAVVEDPEPGVWQLVVSNEADSYRVDPVAPADMTPGTFQIEAILKSSNGEVSGDGRVHVMTRFGDGVQQLSGLPLAARRIQELVLRPDAFGGAVTDIEVPAGATKLNLSASAIGSDLDIYLYAITSNGDIEAGWQGDSVGTAPEHLSIVAPKPGKYRIVVDPYRLAGESVKARLSIEVFHPDYGRTKTNDGLAPRQQGIGWSTEYQLERGRRNVPKGWNLAAYLSVLDHDAVSFLYDEPHLHPRSWWSAVGRQPTKVAVPVGLVEVPAEINTSTK